VFRNLESLDASGLCGLLPAELEAFLAPVQALQHPPCLPRWPIF
jgi:hypothetical protein